MCWTAFQSMYLQKFRDSTKLLEVRGNLYTYDDSKMIQLLLFGDQLTVARARSASMLRDPQLSKKDALKGCDPVISDWHARICLLEVCTC